MTSPSITSLTAGALACALLATIASTPATFAESAAAPASTKILAWRTDLEAALADAAKQNKTVLLRFTATWCAPCRVMDARVWPDPLVQAELADKKFILVKSDIDDDSSQLLARKYGVRGVPTLLLLDGKRKEIARSGFMSSPETLAFLKTTAAKASHP